MHETKEQNDQKREHELQDWTKISHYNNVANRKNNVAPSDWKNRIVKRINSQTN